MQFNWKRRDPPRSLRAGRMLVGLGVATASRNVHNDSAKARIAIDANGEVTVACGTIEQGCGSPTVYAQLAAEILGIPINRVRFVFGDTNLPEAPLAAGSQTSSSVGSVVVKAATMLRDKLAAGRGSIPASGIAFDVAYDVSATTSRSRRKPSERSLLRFTSTRTWVKCASCVSSARTTAAVSSMQRPPAANTSVESFGESAWRSSSIRGTTRAVGAS